VFAYPPPGHYLLPTERRVLRCRRHWAILVPNVVVTTVVVVCLVVLSSLVSGAGSGASSFVHSVLWYVEVFAVARLAVVIADWWDDVIMITGERIMNVSGLLASKMKDTPISKITDRDIRHSVLGNLLGYGTIIIESAGPKSLQRLTFVPEPMTFYEAIVKLTSKKGLPPPASGDEQHGGQPSIEQKSAEWPVDE
jgi:uncharacterized membrane protein YdbT with pleckstrin-like domain